MELQVEPRALEGAAGLLSTASRALSEACGRADAALTAGAASLDTIAAHQVGAGWSRLRAAVQDLATGYDRVGATLSALAQVYVELDQGVIGPGGGPR